MLLRFPTWAVLLILAHGCATEPGPAHLMQLGPQAAANREAQTRRFSGASEAELLAACVGVLQDQGFRITTSEARLGVITGIKSRSDQDVLADVGRQLALASVTLGLHPDIKTPPPDSYGVVLVTRRIGSEARTHDVRATFYQMLLGQGALASPSGQRYAAVITSPALYQQFFGRLDAALARSRPIN